MAPKKKQHQQKHHHKSNPKSSNPQSSSSSGTKQGPKLQLSEENERRLRRLLLNTEIPLITTIATDATIEADNLSINRKAKKLRNVYDKLSLEGFTSDQIEKALSVLNDGATFDSALDWLCLNIPGNELPLKFSRGASASASHEGEERTIRIISTARDDWVPSYRSPEKVKGLSLDISVKKKTDINISLDSGKSSQADWIRRYMENQAEEEEQEYDKLQQQQEGKDADVGYSEASIAKEYHLARMGALDAKKQKDRKKQEHFNSIICKIRQQLVSLGISDEILLTSSLPNEGASNACAQLTVTDSLNSLDKVVGCDDFEELVVQSDSNLGSSDILKNKEITEEMEGPGDLELDNLFSEDSSFATSLPSVLKPPKKVMISLGYGSMLGNVDEIWRKGDSNMIPKAVLQRLCQRLGWEAPKYNRLHEKEKGFLYAVSILRTASGRGKSRKSGGMITLQIPDGQQSSGSAEDAQNKVATFALYRLFSDVPLDHLLREPYTSLLKRWKEDDSLNEVDNFEESRRTGFVHSLLNKEISGSAGNEDATKFPCHESFEESHFLGEKDSEPPSPEVEVNGFHRHIKVESYLLLQELEKRKKMPKYMEMLQNRSSLPISQMKSHLLELLRVNEVVVICGETGCGKTTQVPQFILDDMIESRLGGLCNIICTQPRRIAAISVAERVSSERCEPPPGLHGSVVGYQVRLESSRNDRTKLLFCTTGILLRKLVGDRDLQGVTHVIVDEVHERSLLGDFLLIVLKDLLERRSSTGLKLKVILMSATVDANLFMRYFNNCPVITVEGRTHPVTSYYLEDIYEKLSYTLPSDSLVSGRTITSARGKLGGSSVDNRRGKKNIVLSAWGDESLLEPDYINPHYLENAYEAYSEKTRKNLKSLREDIIDYDLLEDLICFIDENYEDGAILVFLPGVAEINLLVDRLIATYRFGGSSSDWILPLHSSLASTEQRKVFLSPPQNIRKVILATDIAETSITIDDVIYVIDTGKHKEKRYNPQKKMSSMVEDWISQANAKQRRGRAGRVMPGTCFCLYTRHRFNTLMRLFQMPEILRVPLAELCLQVKSLLLGDIKSFLSKAIEPPSEDSIASAVSLLYEVGALEGEEELTPLGYHLAKLPVDVLIGKMMLYGAIFGCLSPTLSIAAFLSYKHPFVFPKDEKQDVERAKTMLMSENLSNSSDSSEGKMDSDHLLLVAAYKKWSLVLREDGPKAAERFCRSYFLSSSVMYMIRDMRIQFGNLLVDIGLINLPSDVLNGGKLKDKFDGWFADISQPFNMYSHQSSIIKSIVCAGLYPNVASTREGIANYQQNMKISDLSARDHPSWWDGKREVHIHPSSVNFNVKKFRYPFMVFLEKVETSKIFLRDTTVISPYSILLFGGSISVQHQAGILIIDDWLKLTAPAQIAVLFKKLRATLHAVLKELIRKPEMTRVVKNELVQAIAHLLLDEDNSCSE